MNPLSIGVDTSALAGGLNLAGRKIDLGGQFEALLAQLTQNLTGNAGQTSSTTTAQAAASATSATTSTSASASSPLPIERLRQSLESTGQPLDKFEVAAADRGELEDLLVASGYRREDARQLMERSSKDDGSVNLGALFAQISQYVPVEGPRLLLGAEDKPLLIQTLKDLGISPDKIEQFLAQLPREGDKLVVQGLPALLAQADQSAKKVDRAVLGDLLTRLGLDEDEVKVLLDKATDNQGNTNAKSVLALLQVAADRQDQIVGKALKELAGKVQVARETKSDQPSDTTRLKAQVDQALAKIDGKVEQETRTLSRHWQQALNQAEAALESKTAGQAAGLADNPASAALRQALAQDQSEAAAWEQASPRLTRAEAGQQAGKMVDASLEASREQATSEAQTARPVTARPEAQAVGQTQAATTTAGRAATQTPTETQALAGPAAAGAGTVLGGASQAKGVLPGYVVRQVGDQMAQMVAKQQTTLRLELKPPTLGELNVELSVKDGAVKATLTAESVAAKQALEAGMDQLKQQLAQQGLRVERMEILLNPDAQDQQQQTLAQAQTGFGRSRREAGGGEGPGPGGEETDAPAAAALDASQPSGRINLFA